MVDIARAVPADLPALVESAAALFAEDGGTRDPYMDTGWPAREGSEYYGGLIGSDSALCSLARDGGAVVGHLVGRVRKDELHPGLVVGVLESMRVADGGRRGGVGTALVADFLGWARGEGATRFTVSAYAANAGAIAFYRAQGFEPFEVVLRLGD
ncbi:GNAT family N-acetyltransferase [Actinokineospora guangxiensis]|uniref:GNAT family N-acetyltransferase n=1 Tax=Actinokineospora guangxiensis TaxID=1490288 RepID=A0ABW0ESV0_9PSEU